MKKFYLFLIFAVTLFTGCQKDELLDSNDPVDIKPHLKSALIETEPNNNVQSANGVIYSGDTFSGTIESSGAYDYIQYSHSGGPVAFLLTGTTQYQNLGLRDANNNYVGESWTISPNQYLVYIDIAPGNYYIAVSGYGGDYTVQINPPFSPGEVTYFRILREIRSGYNGWKRDAYQYACANYNFAGGVIEPVPNYDGFIALMHPYYPWYQETQNTSFSVIRSGVASNGFPTFTLSLYTN